MLLRVEGNILQTQLYCLKQFCLNVHYGECQSLSLPYPQQQIQIEVSNSCPVVIRKIGLGGGSIIWTPRTLEILYKAICTAVLV